VQYNIKKHPKYMKNPTVNFRWVEPHQIDIATPRVGDLVEADIIDSDSLGNLQFVITEIYNSGEIEISRLYPHERASASELKGRVELAKWLPSYDVLLKHVIN
jgi:hypothetical protein